MKILSTQMDRMECETIGNTLEEAFAADPFVRGIFIRDLKGIGRLMKIATRYCNAVGAVHRTADGAAAATWVPPGVPFLSPKEVIRAGMFADLAGMIARTSKKDIKRMFDTSSALGASHPGTPHYYLFAIATKNSVRRKGYGHALMEKAFELYGEHSPYYLENSNEKNLPFYARHGFEVLKETRIAGVPVWMMGKNLRLDQPGIG